ncbi:MAG: HNH endonuclease [Elusimicrobia bacterium]|nr:HNH endonuclease [Elusimicrobiota bacterium]
MVPLSFFRSLGNQELLQSAETLAAAGREHLSELLACLGEIDRRKLHADAGYHSLFAYCVGRLRCSEAEAYRRIRAARVAARHPEILSFLRDGTLSLTAVSLLAPHLHRQDFPELIARAQGLSQNKLELLLADIAPEQTRRDCIRYLGHAPLPALPSKDELFAGIPEVPPAWTASPSGGDGPAIPATSAPSPETAPSDDGTTPGPAGRAPHPAGPTHRPLVRFSFTADEGLLNEVERARDLLRHKYPHARLEDIFREALDEFLERRDPDRKLARTKAREERLQKAAGRTPGADAEDPHPPRIAEDDSRPRAAPDRSKRIPQRVRDKVWERDGGRCAHVAPDGRRCEARGMLEFDHIVPWALGGLSDDPDNIRLLCRTHNQLAARAVFGRITCP